MLWHVTKIDFKRDTTEADRTSCEELIRSHLDSHSNVQFFRLGRCIKSPMSTLVMSGFASEGDLDEYYSDPRHHRVHEAVQRLRTGGRSAIDIWTDDPLDALVRSFEG